ncbi:HAMP domain-containing histidine kinase [Fodinisporobacter ferrooxydans]|uniref:histidine kinase n=1 Tax=Fodinisporobacter ferrooxydans TaxID=2901836 RepID=A0ABY4CNP9_9BACL|nr:HAMP domain-containing histidine kinase [Alicyclobacillaceae bacterium MYW30-H2]
MGRWSLFAKLTVLLVSTMFMTALVLGVVGSSLYRGFIVRDRQEILLEQGQTIADLLAKQAWSKTDMQAIINLSANARVSVYVFDQNAKMLVQSTNHTKNPDKNQDENWYNEFNKNLVKQALGGKIQLQSSDTTLQESTFFGPMNVTLDVAVPIRKNGQVTGAVVLRWFGLTHHLDGVYRLLIFAGIAAIIVTFVFSFYFLRRVSRPLREMNAIIHKMSKGDFSQKLEDRSKDEVGELAKAFNHMADELASLETMRREFIAHASHELRSPLTSIRGFAGAILDGTIPQNDQKTYLQRIHREVLRLGVLVDDLLDLSQLENKQTQMSENTMILSMPAIIREVIASLEPLLYEKKLQIQMELEDVCVYGEAGRIEQVMINLLTNAIHFSHMGGDIEIRVRKNPDQGFIEIKDYGQGIPKEELEKVFERFYKVDKARSSKNSGTGLGLSIAKRIVEMHGGRIGLESERGQWTRVWFTLPLVPDIE